MTSILDEFAKQRRVCLRSKRWWNEEIAELRNAKGRALRTNWGLRHEAARVARRDLRRTTRRAKKNCWDNFLENASGEDVWTAARYTNPKLDDSAKPLINGERTAVARDDKEQCSWSQPSRIPRPTTESRPPKAEQLTEPSTDSW